MVCAVSLEKFLNEVAGTYKLNNRANKSVKDKHNQNLLAQSISARLKRGEADLDVLGSEYENELSDSFRNKEGIYYTPLDVVEDMLSVDLLPDYSELTFCDPCCGSGNFLMRALELGISPDNIYGFDTDPVAVAIAKQRILEKTGKECKNIQNADFLEYITQTDLQFDLIFTNPPWGKKIDAESKVQLSNYFATGKSNDTSSLFFFAAIKSLKEGGYLGFLLQEAFFNIQIFEDARNKALQYKILKMKDYGKCFDGLITKAQAITLQKCSEEKHDILCEGADYSHFRERESFKQNPKAIFNFFCSAEDSKIIEHIYNQPHITLQNRAEWGMGIVTGNNSKFLQSENQAGYIPVYKGADISEGGLKNASNYIPADLSLYQQVAPIHLYQAKEKLIYKFISSKLSFVCDRKQSFFLNSANMERRRRHHSQSAC
jgi:site-specific DNA-methyltransferase (adenine-specific)